MKGRFSIPVIAALFAFAVAGYAQHMGRGRMATTPEHDQEIETVLEDIQTQQGVENIEDIEPGEVDEEHLEMLGEEYMERMHPDQREHLMMDEMMGGEGSQTLAALHRMMGYRYLASLTGKGGFYPGEMGPGMMGYGMGRPKMWEKEEGCGHRGMHPGMRGYEYMNRGYRGPWGIMGFIFIISLTLLALALAGWFIKLIVTPRRS